MELNTKFHERCEDDDDPGQTDLASELNSLRRQVVHKGNMANHNYDAIRRGLGELFHTLQQSREDADGQKDQEPVTELAGRLLACESKFDGLDFPAERL